MVAGCRATTLTSALKVWMPNLTAYIFYPSEQKPVPSCPTRYFVLLVPIIITTLNDSSHDRLQLTNYHYFPSQLVGRYTIKRLLFNWGSLKAAWPQQEPLRDTLRATPWNYQVITKTSLGCVPVSTPAAGQGPNCFQIVQPPLSHLPANRPCSHPPLCCCYLSITCATRTLIQQIRALCRDNAKFCMKHDQQCLVIQLHLPDSIGCTVFSPSPIGANPQPTKGIHVIVAAKKYSLQPESTAMPLPTSLRAGTLYR